MPKMTALLDGGSTPGLQGAHHVLEGSYSGGGEHIINWRRIGREGREKELRERSEGGGERGREIRGGVKTWERAVRV